MSHVIEIDCDGVLVDIWASSEKWLKEVKGLDFCFAKSVSDWGMSTVSKDIRKLLIESFGTPEVIENAPLLYSDAEMHEIAILMKNICGRTGGGVSFVLHSHLFNDECGAIRLKKLNELVKLYDLPATVVVSVGKQKAVLNSQTVIDDCIDNVKVALERGATVLVPLWFHNASYSLCDYSSAYNVTGLYEALEMFISSFLAGVTV